MADKLLTPEEARAVAGLLALPKLMNQLRLTFNGLQVSTLGARVGIVNNIKGGTERHETFEDFRKAYGIQENVK